MDLNDIKKLKADVKQALNTLVNSRAVLQKQLKAAQHLSNDLCKSQGFALALMQLSAEKNIAKEAASRLFKFIESNWNVKKATAKEFPAAGKVFITGEEKSFVKLKIFEAANACGP